MSVVIVGLYALGHFGLQISGATFFVPDIVLVLAGATALYSLFAYLFVKDQKTQTTGLIAFSALCITVMVLISMTGSLHSPFVALWLLIAVFAGLFGTIMLGAFALVANAYGIFQIVSGVENGTAAILLMIVIETPLLISGLIWHQKHLATKDAPVVSALQQQLSQVASRSDIIINSIADGVVVIDAKGVLQLLNPAAQTMLGWPGSDAVGLDFRSVIKLTNAGGNPIADDLSPIHQAMASNKAVTNNDLTLVSRSNKKFSLSLVVSPVGVYSPASGVIAVFRDITHEKEEERQQAEFISTASHEMRTPVAAIEGYLGLAMNPATAVIDDKARTYLQKAHESTQHLGRLFQDLLTVSKAEDARLIPKQQAVDMISFTREIADGLAAKAKEKGLFIQYAPGGDGEHSKISPVYYAFIDPDQLREVLSNLIDNAIKYTRQGSIVVDVSGDPDNITVSVTDTGIGIPPEDLPHLFQKFYRVDNSDTREIGGTGLGLYISRRLTEANSGHITVTSTFGKGSTFSVQVPRISNERATELLSTPPAQSIPAQTATAPVATQPPASVSTPVTMPNAAQPTPPAPR